MALELKSVSKTIGSDTHIHPTDLRLERGTMNVLLGRTLSGKTSLMRIMAGLDRPDAGSVFWDNQDVTGLRVQERDVAMVYQQFINYPSMTVYENIASPLRIRRMQKSEIDTRVREAAALMKLSEKQLGRRPLELSGGQQQRCALARALIKEAGLVLLDEPLANLDYKLREELRTEIPKIFEASGAIFVYATTEPHEALLLGGNTACLWEGRITQFGLTPDVYRRPMNTIAANVFSDPPMNFFTMTKRGSEITETASGKVMTSAFGGLDDGTYQVGFRANHLTLAPRLAGFIAFDCTCSGTEITGSESFIHLRHGDQSWVALEHGVHDVAGGEELITYLDPAHAYIFAEDDTLIAAAAYAEAA
ncbi:MAG: ABC transporter ATP-binding protein [Pseudomonadota bacterium]